MSSDSELASNNTIHMSRSTRIKAALSRLFVTKKFHFLIIGIVFLDLSLLLAGLVLAIYATPESLMANFVLFLFSWVFPTIFFIELGLKIWVAGGWSKYFVTSLKKWDAGILLFSVVSDIALYVLLMEHASATATAVIVFRLWKIVRVFHIFAHILQLKNEEARKIVLEANDRLQEENEELRQEITILRYKLDLKDTYSEK